MTVALYHYIDLPVRCENAISQPFFVSIEGTFRSEQGTILTVPGFYDGDNTWIVRFSPTETGTWTWKISCEEHSQLSGEGSLECVENANPSIHGGLKVNPENDRCFRYQDGTDYFMMGYEVDWLFALYMRDPDEATAFIDKIAAYRFNSVIMNVYAHECDWSDKTARGLITPPPLFPWGGSNDEPEHSVMNPAFFRQFDRMMDCLLEKGITAHLLLYVYNKSVNWPEKNSPEDRLYIDYVVARYQAFSNVIWDYAKETFYQNDKAYLTAMLQRIREKDAYRRLLTVHDDKIFRADPEKSSILDFVTLQHHQDFHAIPQLEYQRHHCPIVNVEYGYECGAGGEIDVTYGEGIRIPEFMHRTYDVAMGGAFIGYYYTYTAWDIIRPEDTPQGYASFKTFYDLFTSIPWWRYEPRIDLCMWTPTNCFADEESGNYLLKMNTHGRFLMDKDFSKCDVEGSWMHIVTGETRPLSSADYEPYEINPTMTVLAGPFRALSVLHLSLRENSGESA